MGTLHFRKSSVRMVGKLTFVLRAERVLLVVGSPDNAVVEMRII
jgi:hypothetical protein